jgi:hypothetical protein
LFWTALMKPDACSPVPGILTRSDDDLSLRDPLRPSHLGRERPPGCRRLARLRTSGWSTPDGRHAVRSLPGEPLPELIYRFGQSRRGDLTCVPGYRSLTRRNQGRKKIFTASVKTSVMSAYDRLKTFMSYEPDLCRMWPVSLVLAGPAGLPTSAHDRIIGWGEHDDLFLRHGTAGVV